MKPNRAGRIAEDVIAGIAASVGIECVRQAVVGRTIYGTDLRSDFVFQNVAEYPNGVAVESKWQDVGGSVDEKFPYLVANIRECYPLPVIVVVHGGGCRPGAVAWLRRHCDGRQFVGVWTLEEFISWALRVPKLVNS